MPLERKPSKRDAIGGISHASDAPVEMPKLESDDGAHRPAGVDLAQPFGSTVKPVAPTRDVHHSGEDGYDTHDDDDDGPKLTPISHDPTKVDTLEPPAFASDDDDAHRPVGVDLSMPFPSARPRPIARERDVHHAGEDGYDTHEDDDDDGPKLTPIAHDPTKPSVLEPPAFADDDDGAHRPEGVDLTLPFPSERSAVAPHRDVHHAGEGGYETHDDDDDE